MDPPPPPYDPRRIPAYSSSSSSASYLRYPHHHHHYYESSSQNRSSYHLVAPSSSHSHGSYNHHHSQYHPNYYSSTTPVYYLTSSSRSTTPSESVRHNPSSSMAEVLYRRPEGLGSNPDPPTRKNHRMVDEFCRSRSISGSSDQRDGKRSVSGSSDQQDRKRPRVSEKSNGSTVDFRERNSTTVDFRERNSTTVEFRERNSRSSYDSTGKEHDSRHNYRHYDKEKKEISDAERTPQKKPSAKSRISVWSRIEEKPSSTASPPSSNRSNNRANAQQVSQGNKPEREASVQSAAPDKNLGTGRKAAEVSGEVTGKKKKKVIIRKKIVKKKGKLKIDSSAISSSSPVDPIVEGKGSDGKRRVKRVLLLKKKKGAKAPGETSGNEEIIRQIATQVFSEKKSVEGSRPSSEKSADKIESKIDDSKNVSLVLFEKNSSISNGTIDTSHMEISTKDEVVEALSPNKVLDINGRDSVLEAPSDLEITRHDEGKEFAFTLGSAGGEECVKENTEGDVSIDEVHEMTPPRLNSGIENVETESMMMQVDVPREEEKQVNDTVVDEKDSDNRDEEMKNCPSKGDTQLETPKEGDEPTSVYTFFDEKDSGNRDEEMKNCPSKEDIQLETPKEGDEPTSVCTVVDEKDGGNRDEEMKNCPSKEDIQLETPKEGDEPTSVYALIMSSFGLPVSPKETSSSDLVLGQETQDLPQTIDFSLCESNSLPQTENESNDVIISTEINENISVQKRNSVSISKLNGSSTNGENVDRANLNQEQIQKNEKETQKPVFQKSVSVGPVPKFSVQKPRHKTWCRETSDCVNPGLSAPNHLPKPPLKRALPQNSYIRKGNSLIRSASGTTVLTNSSIPRIPSPKPNPPVLDMSREATAVSSPVHESEGEDQRGLEKGVLQNTNNKMVYFKKKNNQIVLNNGHSNDSQYSKGFVPLENAASTSHSNSDDNRDSVHYLSDSGMMGLIKKSIDKAPRRMTKVASYPNVWTLSDNQSKRNDCTSTTTGNFLKSFPCLLPWKRNTLLKRSTRKRSILHRSSSSWLIRKLVLARRRDAVYAVSKDGFSLRKTGVLAIGGSNLKWSRTIEKNSKKACEEATLAVAEVERKKREKRKRVSLRNKGKKGSKALFATGSGKRTGSDLNRLSACSGYVRVNKGNQLVRNPKKLVRILASEKIQRSLHTLRNAKRKKQQYCLFYTRFGRCNKIKCTYIHDSAKIAICTKFLRGICVNTDCKLTHQIIPERMPDCSYFLQGLCTNLTCPYRHVNVNPKAPVCEGFLRGYCSDGDECRKKHSYTCPDLEQKGKCLQGSKCKLYHPRTKSKAKKQKPSPLQKSGSRSRYFESSIGSVELANPEKIGDELFSHGQPGDFISLHNGRGGDGLHSSVDAFEPMKLVLSDSDGSDLEVDDELIKPVWIMRRARLTVP